MMSKKDEALKIAIEVMNNYQNGWMPDEMASAMIACQKALKKEWQGLTEEEVKGACKNSDEGFNVSAFRQGVNWAEQKLKEKNT